MYRHTLCINIAAEKLFFWKRPSDTQNRHHVINDALRGVLRDVGRTLEESRAQHADAAEGREKEKAPCVYCVCAHKSDRTESKGPEKTSKTLSGETIDQQQENDLMAE